MKYCEKCVMPDTRPGSIFGEEGICQACRNHAKGAEVDWKERFIVEKFWNPELFENVDGLWRLKGPVYSDRI